MLANKLTFKDFVRKMEKKTCRTRKQLLMKPGTYAQTYTRILPWVLAMLHYFGNVLPLIDSLSCDLQDKVNIIGYDVAGGPVTLSKMAAHMATVLDFT